MGQKETRKALDQIDEILNQLGKDDRGQVWDVLTALRGPDFPDPYPAECNMTTLKEATTAVIRSTAFPTARSYLESFGTFLPDSLGAADRRREHFNTRTSKTMGDHFTRHARRAFRALGLEWHYPNPVP